MGTPHGMSPSSSASAGRPCIGISPTTPPSPGRGAGHAASPPAGVSTNLPTSAGARTIQAVSDPALKPCTTSRFDSFHWCLVSHMSVGERRLHLMTLTPAQLDRAVGALLGTAASDALGAPYEFGSPRPPTRGRDGGRRELRLGAR